MDKQIGELYLTCIAPKNEDEFDMKELLSSRIEDYDLFFSGKSPLLSVGAISIEIFILGFASYKHKEKYINIYVKKNNESENIYSIYCDLEEQLNLTFLDPSILKDDGLFKKSIESSYMKWKLEGQLSTSISAIKTKKI